MLQHASMSHAFQSAATGVSSIEEDCQRASQADFKMFQGRTYQVSKLPELDYAINVTIFSDILELDDEDEQYFSRSLVCDFFALAQRTFTEMDACLLVHCSNTFFWTMLTEYNRETQDIKQLWSKARFLRGPSATLGIYKVESNCARIEQMTAVSDTFQADGDWKTMLCNSTRVQLEQAKQHFAEAESALRRFYAMD
jgi:osomolarity two-component system phosphorelay intermediate protein YPD1